MFSLGTIENWCEGRKRKFYKIRANARQHKNRLSNFVLFYQIMKYLLSSILRVFPDYQINQIEKCDQFCDSISNEIVCGERVCFVLAFILSIKIARIKWLSIGLDHFVAQINDVSTNAHDSVDEIESSSSP